MLCEIENNVTKLSKSKLFVDKSLLLNFCVFVLVMKMLHLGEVS